MAGDWIKMRSDLHTHPKVVRISSALHADRLRVIGGLHAVWCLFDAHSEDGSLDGYSLDAIDELIGWAGFATALQSVGWLVLAGDSVSLPRFDEHNGRSAKRRVMETERKRRERFAHGAEQLSASEADTKRTREEKIREELSIPEGIESRQTVPPAPNGTRLSPGWELPSDWHAWAMANRSDLDIHQVAQQFKDHWLAKPGRDGTKADWFATFRNWVRREKSQAAQSNAGRSSQKFDPVAHINRKAYERPVTVLDTDVTVVSDQGRLPY